MAWVARRHGSALPSAARAAALVLALAAPVGAQGTGEVFGDWELACPDEGDCTLSQANAEPGTDNVRMRSVFTAPGGERLLLSVTVPSSVLLSEGPWLTVDGVYLGALDYVNCTSGCLARTFVTAGEATMLAAGSRGVVTVTTSAGQRIGIPVSLNGLTAGLTALLGAGAGEAAP